MENIERRSVAVRALSSTGAVVASLGVLLCGCSKVNVTPLGSTSEGRKQFEITCNERASNSGSCHEKAIGVCGGDYETLDIERAELKMASYGGQLFTASPQRVLLIACHR
jgi:hypothetical protein